MKQSRFRRSPRIRGVPRKRTIARKSITREDLRIGALMYPRVEDPDRPRTRGECREQARPCPYVSCSHHLYLDVNPETGSITLNFPDREVWELAHTCSLDEAERGGLTLEETGDRMNLTRERSRQLEVRGLLKMSSALRGAA